MNADPEYHLGFFGKVVIPLAEHFLEFDGRVHRFDHTVEFGNHGIAGGMENAAPVLLDDRNYQTTAGLDILKRQLFVAVHQLADPYTVSGQNRREFSGQFCRFHDLGMEN